MSDFSLLPEQEELLRILVEARECHLPERRPFHYHTESATSAAVTTLMHPGLPGGAREVFPSDLDALERGDYIIRKTFKRGGKFDLTGKALSLYESLHQPDTSSADSSMEQARTVAPVTTADQEGVSAEFVFRRDGETWMIRYSGETKHFKDSLGMKALWFLVSNEGEGFTPHEMIQAIDRLSGTSPSAWAMSESRAKQEGLEITGPADAGEVMDASYRRERKQRVLELMERKKEAEETGNEEEKIKVQEELEELEKKYAPSYEHDGSPTKGDNKGKILWKSVYENIRRAELRIKPEFPRLFRHLRTYTRKSPLFAYRPDDSLHWRCW